MDYSFLPPLPTQKMNGAIRLNFEPFTLLTGSANIRGWDNSAYYGTSAQYALLQSTFAVTLKKGATYDISSSSFFDPFILELHDSTGKVIAVDTGDGTYGYDYIYNFKPTTTGTYYISASWDQGLAIGHRYVSVGVYEDVDTIPKILPVQGTAGIDTVSIIGTRAAASFTIDGQTVTIIRDGHDDKKFVNIERYKFEDITIATDIQGTAGKAYRLYEAAFNRKPDASGLGFWIKAIDGGTSLQSVASQFVASKEFGTLFGTDLSDRSFVSALYENVLNRPLDQSGADYWLTALGNGASRAQILINFSESTENQQGVIGAIQNGIQYEFFG